MFKSYLTSTLRDILSNKIYSSINIIGLTVALAACILITIFVKDELGYDAFVPNPERTYRIEVTAKSPNRADELYAHFMGAYAPLIKERSRDVEDTTRYQTNRIAVKVGQQLYYENVTFSDVNFLSFMGIKAPANILDDSQSIILTQTMANKYFATNDPIGQIMTLNGDTDYRVAHVIDDLPQKSQLAIQMIAPYNLNFLDAVNSEFMSMNNITFVRMKEGQDIAAIKDLIPQLIDENVPARAPGVKSSNFRVPTFVAIQDVYLKSQAGVVGKSGGDINIVIGFISIAILILVIATVNYINLATARAIKRSREVGIRKVMGATRKQLITQFLGESTLITLISLIIALALVEFSLPFLNEFLNREMTLTILGNGLNLIILIMISVVIGIVAGLYPALYLSSFNPAKVLKSETGTSGSGFLRQFLVFMQFAIAISLIAGTTVVVRQTIYATSLDPGYEKSGVLLIRNLRPNNLLDQIPLLDQQLLTIAGVTDVSASQFVPTDPYDFTTGMYFEGDPDNRFGMSILSHQADFFDLYRLRLKAGRALDNRAIDRITQFPQIDGQEMQTTAVLNETAARGIGFSNPQDAVGKVIYWPQRGQGRNVIFTVVGIVEDFHLRSIHSPIRTMLYFNSPSFYRTLSVRFATDDFASFIGDLENIWAQIAPGVPLGYQILSQQMDSFYSSENRQMKIFVGFAVLAILISAIGLLGLTAFSAERRTKEIGIRKTLGARNIDIIRLMVGQFSKPVFVANIVALPIAWWIMDQWLSNYVYRVDLNIFYFLGAGLLALIVAWFTVTLYSIKIARANPITALRYE